MAQHNIAQQEDLVGVSLEEMQTMQEHFGVEFPASYVQFLYTCGRSAGHLAGWGSIYFDDLKEIAEDFTQYCSCSAASSHNANKLPTKALLIAHYEGCFDYIICDTPEPQVFRIGFNNEQANHCLLANSFNDYLKLMIKAKAKTNDRVAPFFIDECGNMISDDLTIEAPLVE